MKAVLAAFRAPFADKSAPRELSLPEFSSFWKSLSEVEKEEFKAEALAMGFKE